MRYPFWVTAQTQYELVERIHRGEYSTIYKAKELGSGRVLAVKKFVNFMDPYKNFRFREIVEEEWRMADSIRGGVSMVVEHLTLP